MSLDRNGWRVGAMALVVCLIGCGKGSGGSNDPKQDPKDQALPVEVTTIARGGIEATFRNSTHLEAEEEVKVFARTANRVTELLVEEGDQVKKDQVLLRLDNDIQKTASAKAQVSLDKAREEFEREKALFDQKLVSEQVFNDTKHSSCDSLNSPSRTLNANSNTPRCARPLPARSASGWSNMAIS